jgi:hypothetical protein
LGVGLGGSWFPERHEGAGCHGPRRRLRTRAAQCSVVGQRDAASPDARTSQRPS